MIFDKEKNPRWRLSVGKASEKTCVEKVIVCTAVPIDFIHLDIVYNKLEPAMAAVIYDRNTEPEVISNGILNPTNIHVLRVLERGLVLNRFFSKRRPEKRMFQMKLETRQLIWIRVAGGRPEGVSEYIFQC